MFSYLSAAFNYFFPKKCEEEDDHYLENFLAEQLMDLETNNKDTSENVDDVSEARPIPRTAACFQRTGRITYMADNYVLIDGMLYFDKSSCSLNLNVDDKILYLGYEDSNASIIVVRILENQGTYWGEEEDVVEESSFKVIEHVIVGEVDYRQERNVFIKNSDLKFNLDDVKATFVPVQGDWLELKCSVQFNEEKPSDINSAQVLQVISFKPLRSRIKDAVVTDWSGESGTCDRLIYFDKQSLQNGIEPHVGSKVMIEAIESNQGTCTWRAIKMISIETPQPMVQNDSVSSDDKAVTLRIEQEKNIDFTYPIKFDKVDFQKTAQMVIGITNNSDQVHIINKWIVLSRKCDSQVNIQPVLTQPRKLAPKETFNMTVKCYPKFLGNAKECLIIMFRGFQLKRFIELNVVNNFVSENESSQTEHRNGLKSEQEKINIMKKVFNNRGNSCVPGVKPIKPPAFVPVRLGSFPIPEKIWSVVLGDSGQTVYTSEFNKIVDRIEINLPYLAQDLNIHNYTDIWHALLYMEEIQCNINIRVYDTQKAFLIRCQEYLALEIQGLAEKRPSLIKGDRVIVKDVWESTQYEGFIHAIKGDLILMKFSPIFHERYSGSDVSIEFHFSRSVFRRSHQAINLGMANLGPDVLFPSRIVTRPPLVTQERIEGITWINDKLNTEQKAAVKNILKAEARPLPYCIFGPPGTGKTVTVIETILQILETLPDSRILVATPSNSAANLITERLIQSKDGSSNSIIRLIANYLVDSDSIPEVIKPFCATLDIAREETWKTRNYVQDGIKMNCQTSFVGRHRVTIGTCYCLGMLAQMGLPKGHFTHVIVDEAGQATEPEIMIPLTFIDKEHGQIVLAGDPKQLGPVILSKYCLEFGMDESYFSRILETFPYQRDFKAFKNGFNPKLVTKLNDNYRSLEEVLNLPSEMFYDGSLVAKIDRNEAWVEGILKVFSEMFECSDPKKGGIYVYGIRGCNTRAEDSPSWYNPQEASMVALTTCKLYKKNINIDDIGIITPYIAQIRYLRLVFEAMGLPQPKIGTVEEFQGQERPIILISTVRSTEHLLGDDQKHSLGFVKSPKRLNVALTRAQVAVILFCNPHLLCVDTLWKRVLAQAVAEEKFMGCDLPCALIKNKNNVDE